MPTTVSASIADNFTCNSRSRNLVSHKNNREELSQQPGKKSN